MKTLARGLPVWLPGFLLSPLLFAQSVGQLTLHEVLEVAVKRGAVAGEHYSSPTYQASSWLAGLPALSLSYLESDERHGTDEAELSVQLPVKSATRRSADDSLLALATGLDEIELQQRSLYFSGLIREALWSYRLADTRRRFASKKRQLLLELELTQRELLAASASSEYALLLLQTELVEVEISQQSHLQEARRWLQRYRQVTGLAVVPDDIHEPGPEVETFNAGIHPQLRALDLLYSQRRQVLLANSTQASDWNLSLTAKNLDTAGNDEQQYGVGVEIPLSIIAVGRQTDNSEWRAAQREYLMARDQLSNQLYGSWDMLMGERQTLRDKQVLLHRASELADRMAQHVNQLKDSNEIAQEIVLRRRMDTIDTSAEVEINQLLLDQNHAMLRQAAGISL